jgi:hypothetical protein
VVGGYFDYLMMEQSNQAALDQQAAASVPKDDGAKFPSTPSFHAPAALHLQSFTAKGGAGGFSVEPAQLSNVAGSMGSSDTSTLAAGTAVLNDGGPMAQISTSGFDAGDALAANFGAAYQGMSTYMQQLLSVYHETVAALRKTVANYTSAESDNAAAANSVND